MKHENKNLEGLLGIGFAAIPTLFHQIKMMELMEKAGMYKLDENGLYSELGSAEGIGYQLSIAAGAFGVMVVGWYLGTKLGKRINNNLKN